MDCVLPAIESTMRSGRAKRAQLHVVALDPAREYQPEKPLPILFEHSIGEDKWEKDYRGVARAKAGVSWRTGLSSREAAALKPALIKPGDTRWPGSAIVGGIVSAASGVQSYNDEMYAYMTSAALNAEAHRQLTEREMSGELKDILS